MPAAKSRGHSAHFRFTSSHLQANNLAEPRRAVLADPLSTKLNRVLHRTAEDASCRIFAYDDLVTIRKKLNCVRVRLKTEPASEIFRKNYSSCLVNLSHYSQRLQTNTSLYDSPVLSGHGNNTIFWRKCQLFTTLNFCFLRFACLFFILIFYCKNLPRKSDIFYSYIDFFYEYCYTKMQTNL